MLAGLRCSAVLFGFGLMTVSGALGAGATDLDLLRKSALAALEAEEFDRAEPKVRELAARDDAAGQLWLGFMHVTGAGVLMDDTEARVWFERAAAKGGRLAAMMLIAVSGKEFELEVRDRWIEQATRPSLLVEDVPASLMVETARELSPNYDASYRWNRVAAEEGSATALFTMARFHLSGLLGASNLDGYHEYLRRAAHAGLAKAWAELAVNAELEVLGTPGDKLLAAQYRLRAAEAGDVEMQHRVGIEYWRGTDEREADPAEARRWLEAAVAQEHVPAMVALGDLLRSGHGGSQDDRGAAELYARAARSGNIHGMFALGRMLDRENGPAEDLQRARELYREAAEAGHISAWNALARMRRLGLGGPRNLEGAKDAYYRAAGAGNVFAMVQLGRAYRRSLLGVRNSVRAYEWMLEAAQNGNAEGAYEVAKMLIEGTGVESDPAAGVDWLRQSADREYRPAQHHLARLYRDGDLVPNDPEQSRSLLEKVAESAAREPQLRIRELRDEFRTPRYPRHAGEMLDELRGFTANPDPEVARRAQEALVFLLADTPVPELQRPDEAFALAEGLHTAGSERGTRVLVELLFVGTPRHPRDPVRARALLEELAPTAADPQWMRMASRLLRHARRQGDDALRELGRGLLEEAAAAGSRQARTRLWRLERELLPRETVVLDRFAVQATPQVDEDEVRQRIAALRLERKDARPEPLLMLPPRYPIHSTEPNEPGRVVLVFTVNEEGRVSRVVIEESSNPRFNEPAINAVEQWRFIPGVKKGVPVPSRVRQVVNFQP